jgi:lipopolysaccharide/colanic/teichoic acid biosynthesis glycosyltransferase
MPSALAPPFVWPISFSDVEPEGAVLKRAFDVIFALLLLILTLPILLLGIVVVKVTSRGPVFFVQRRIGYQGREFNMFKLRTMVAGAEEEQERLAARLRRRTFLKLRDDPRVTSAGRVLRTFSIDELPQFWNVIRGDMSLVGPRPLLLCDFRKFPRSEQLRRFVMLPGITGLWQVSGRDACTDAQRIALDLKYVDSWNFRLDLKILCRTLPVVMSGRNAG